jgi:predicted ABC-type ATPase
MKAGGPWFVLVADINGADKSTFAQNHGTLRVLLEARGPEIEVINPDLITHEILRHQIERLVAFPPISRREPRVVPG